MQFSSELDKSGSIQFFKPLHTCAHAHTHIHTCTHTQTEKTQERKGSLSALISRRRCVLEAVQGSTVIGLFSYWGIQSRTEGYGSEQSDPRIPPPAFHPFFLLLLLQPSTPSSALPGTRMLTGRACRSWQAQQRESGQSTTPLRTRLQAGSHRTEWRHPESCAVPFKNGASGNML